MRGKIHTLTERLETHDYSRFANSQSLTPPSLFLLRRRHQSFKSRLLLLSDTEVTSQLRAITPLPNRVCRLANPTPPLPFTPPHLLRSISIRESTDQTMVERQRARGVLPTAFSTSPPLPPFLLPNVRKTREDVTHA